jgi:hypothetical protein
MKMSHQINVHLPPGTTNLNDLSLNDFISQTKTDGGVKTTDLYYHPSAPKNLKEKFLKNLGDLSARLNGSWKPALKSENMEKAFTNIFGEKNIRSKEDIYNNFGAAMTKAAEKGGDYSKNGATVTLVNAENTLIEEHTLNYALRTAKKFD